jgi:dUTP pyrophosphatase
MRKFEVVQDKYIVGDSKEVILPNRNTKGSAGYDFYSPVDETILPNESKLIFTNVKAKFNQDEVLMLFVRSSMGKYPIVIANGTGIIDSDYYGNESNDGNIGFRLLNLSKTSYVIKKGDRIGQGLFLKILFTDDDESKEVRKGGFGSTNK